ncbi:hypothetical protein ACVGVM_19125 [Pseudonocardia bannensis]|uniref:Uncharacterized protein n=1 Tax=Pseudonocardia bannensis TaxID=630973 RepID=A0A848DQ13_9PSEU|nr:hypothetical protein [Pseudonocardia bannensis]NMH94808.1 hypothetical protein [Pseudonocardia bannensis]
MTQVDRPRPRPRLPGTNVRFTVRQLVLIATTWIIATAMALLVAAETKLGPIMLRLTEGHGVHLGDLVALAVCFTSALLITGRVAGPGGRRSGDRG